MQNRAWCGVFAVVFLTGVPIVLSAATAPTDRPWLRIDTRHFTLYGEIPEPRLVLIAGRLETYRAALQALHPGSRASPRETSVYVFHSAESGWPYTPAAVTGGHRLGVAQSFDVPNYVTIAAPEDDPPLDVLLHSYAHQFIDDNFPRLPLTIVEGLAEFYSGFRATPEGSFIGLVNSGHVQRLRDRPALPLAMQFAIEPGASLFAQRGGLDAFVSGSWALVHYLVSGSGPARAQLPEFLQSLQRGVGPSDATRATFGIPLEDLENRIAAYLRGDRFLPLRIESDGTAARATDRDLPRPLGKDEVLTALGEVLGHAGDERAAEAETYFDAALRLNPRQAKALAGSGYLRYSRGRYVEAIDLFVRSIAIEPDAMSCYLLARSLMKLNAAPPESDEAAAGAPAAGSTPEWLARTRRLLSQAIELRPEFAAPYVTLAGTHLLPDGDPEIGVPLLIRARDMLPGRTDIAGSLVYASAATGRPHPGQDGDRAIAGAQRRRGDARPRPRGAGGVRDQPGNEAGRRQATAKRTRGSGGR